MGKRKASRHSQDRSVVGTSDKATIMELLKEAETSCCMGLSPEEASSLQSVEPGLPEKGLADFVFAGFLDAGLDEAAALDLNRLLGINLVREAMRLLQADRVPELFAVGMMLGRLHSRIADFWLIADRMKQLRNKRAAANEARAENAERARELLAAEKEKAGQYFNRTQAIKAVAKKMDVDPKTVGRWLNNSKGQH